MPNNEHSPYSRAPETGIFEEIDPFGSATGAFAFVLEGDFLPGAPRSFAWRALGELSALALRLRGQECRKRADAAGSQAVVDNLLALAERFDELAHRHEQEERNGSLFRSSPGKMATSSG